MVQSDAGPSGLPGDHLRKAIASCHVDEVAVQLTAVIQRGRRPWNWLLTWRRLAAKCLCDAFTSEAQDLPFTSTRLGAEAAIHTARQCAQRHAGAPDQVFLKVDFSNAFNTVDRGAVLGRFACICWLGCLGQVVLWQLFPAPFSRRCCELGSWGLKGGSPWASIVFPGAAGCSPACLRFARVPATCSLIWCSVPGRRVLGRFYLASCCRVGSVDGCSPSVRLALLSTPESASWWRAVVTKLLLI